MEKIILIGGGTGGHVCPLVAVGGELKKQAEAGALKLSLRMMGDGQFAEQEAANMGVPFNSILSPKWRRYSFFENIIDFIKLPFGLVQSFFYMWLYMPDLVFAKGGYASFLPAVAAKFFLIPLVIHESDSVPGVVNRKLAGLSKHIFVSYEYTRQFFKPEKTDVVGNPIRAELLAGGDKSSAAAAFQLDPSKPVLLITGGSQGAKKINDTILLAITELVKRFQVIHQCGDTNYNEVKATVDATVKGAPETYGKDILANYRLYPFLDAKQMALAYAAADVILSRSGGAIFEMAAVGKPSIVVPLKIAAANHQLLNAAEFAKFGAVVITEDNFTPNILINELVNAYSRKEEISQTIKQFARPDAAANVAKWLLDYLTAS
ncbi:MAG: UDP-N-acetylglucosamine--N-acetylmuramyl-(pentapeptide) pyrophosphoryl-undecaprenol N-acetylglucosamine transferase [Parcubacteria group bacterium Licking1014_17]|nr:MAG: UDP-N-acetylglucosamine--N-acetylmuramyl-(pentapeptide) pyrophosphoryl-undecaprenol N-acetylglucosamine transferase [Parcubacteria group bacterium Licking1014_17]